MPSSPNCSVTLQATLNELNTTTNYYEDPIGGTQAYVFNMTEWISGDLADSSRYCLLSYYEMLMWYDWK